MFLRHAQSDVLLIFNVSLIYPTIYFHVNDMSLVYTQYSLNEILKDVVQYAMCSLKYAQQRNVIMIFFLNLSLSNFATK